MSKLIVVAVLFAVAVQALTPLPEETYQFLFTKWAQTHKKVYHHDDFFNRYNVFRANLDLIRAHNAGNSSFTLGMNDMGDLTAEEYKKFLGYVSRDRFPHTSTKVPSTPSNADAQVDWRQKNAVTPVKNQAQCGSCWAFSATGSIEGAHAIKTGTLVSVSEQQLVDCSGPQGDMGCNGGLMDNAFKFVQANGGICAEADYAYTAQTGICQTTCKSVVSITGFNDVAQNDENALLAAVEQNPVSVAVEADQQVFQFYSSGIIDDASCGTQLDHGVLAVGAGSENGTPYWIVKNSWGGSWGESGYLRIVRNKNMCGIAMDPSYPTA